MYKRTKNKGIPIILKKSRMEFLHLTKITEALARDISAKKKKLTNGKLCNNCTYLLSQGLSTRNWPQHNKSPFIKK